MSNFLDNYELYQKSSINITGKIDSLVADFQIADLGSLLSSVDGYDPTKDEIKIHNFLEIISNEKFIEILDTPSKVKVSEKLISKLLEGTNPIENYRFGRFRLVAILVKYGEHAELTKVKEMFAINALRNAEPHLFLRYFREKKELELFMEALKVECGKINDEGEIGVMNIHTEDFRYLSLYPNEVVKFLEFINENDEVIVQFFDQYSSINSWNEPNILSIIEMIKVVPLEKYEIFENIIRHITDLYFEYYYGGKGRDHLDIVDAIKSVVLRNLIEMAVARRPNMFFEMLDYYIDEERSLYGHSLLFFVYGISLKQVEELKNYKRLETWQKMHRYGEISRSKRDDKDEIIAEFKKHFSEEIKEMEQRTEQHQRELEAEQIKENKNLVEEIERICDKLNKNPGFSEKLIYLYEKNPEYFNDLQKEVVKDQIIKILGEEKAFNPKTGKLVFVEGDKNRYTRPDYIGNSTLERCIRLSESFGIELMEYHSKIVSLLPFTFHLDLVLASVEGVDLDDLGYMISVYSKERDTIDNLRLFHPRSFVEFYKKFADHFQKNPTYHQQAIEILEGFVSESFEDVNAYLKSDILWILREEKDSSFFTSLFDKSIGLHKELNYFNDILPNKELDEEIKSIFNVGLTANAILIKEHRDVDAIKRRINQLINATIDIPYPQLGKMHSISPLLEELYRDRDEDTSFLSPLKALKYPDYFSEVQEILSRSLSLSPENVLPGYLQKFVIEYIKSIEKPDVLGEVVAKIETLPNGKTFTESKLSQVLRGYSYPELQVFDLNKILYNLQKENYPSIIIATEGKTDWMHLMRASDELLTRGLIQDDLYGILKNGLVQYLHPESDPENIRLNAGDDQTYKFFLNYALMHPKKNVIFIADGDGSVIKDMRTKNVGLGFNDSREHIYTYDKVPNFFVVILPPPDDNFNYAEQGVCIEHYYSKDDLGGLLVIRDIYGDLVPVKLLGKQVMHIKSLDIYINKKTMNELKTVYDSGSEVIFYDSNLQECQTPATKTKYQLASYIYPTLGSSPPSLKDDATWERFKRITDVIDNIVSGL